MSSAATRITETQRLVLREVVTADAQFLCDLVNEPAWIRNIGDRGVRTAQDAERYIADKFVEPYRSLGFGMYLTELKSDGTALGLCGLVQRNYLPLPDIGFAYLPRYWGQGYAREAAAAIMQYSYDRLGLSKLLAIVMPDNRPSVRLLERLGFKLEGECRVPSTAELLSLYGAALRA